LLRFGLPNQLVEFLALAAGAFPAAGLVANIVPWWRASAPLAIWAVAALGLALVVGLAAFAAGRAWRGGPDRSPSSESPSWRSGLVAPGAVGLFSALVVMMDPFIGRVFLRDAPLGFQTLLAVRLYGYPNTAFAVLVTGAILAVVLFAGVTGANGKRWITAGSVAAVGVVVLVLDAYPKWGADLGGAVAVVAAFMVLGLMAVGVRLNWKWVTAAAVAGLTAAAAVAWLDYRRGPEQWTHLGGFVDTLLAGGLWRVLEGKGMMWLRLSAGPVLGLALGAAVGVPLARHGAFAALKSEAWRRRPMLKPVMVALITAWVVGSLVNDSGLVVAIVGLGVAGPPVAAWLVLAQAQSQNQSQDRVSESEPEPGSGQDREAEPD
jgi:hypothetical protein